MKVMVYFLVFAGGVLNSLQSGSNSQLKKLLGKPWISGVVLYGNALAAFLWVATFLYDPLPTIQDFKNTPWCAYLGGAMGGVAVYAMLTPTDQIGAGPLNAILVTATIVTALLIDHYGFMGVKQHGPNIWRGLGCDRSYGIHRKVLKQNSSTVVLLFTLKTLLVRIDLSRVSRVPTFAKDLRCCFACYRIQVSISLSRNCAESISAITRHCGSWEMRKLINTLILRWKLSLRDGCPPKRNEPAGLNRTSNGQTAPEAVISAV